MLHKREPGATAGVEGEQRAGSRIPVAYLIVGFEENRAAIVNFYRNALTRIDWVIDAAQPAVNMKISWLGDEIRAARSRGVKCRTIAEITKENAAFCRIIMRRIDELRHLGGMGVFFGVSDCEFVAMAPSLAPREDLKRIQFIHSDSESVLEYKRLCFDALWRKAAPALLRIRELEENRAGISNGGARPLIDRIYACLDCHETFVYAQELEEHKSGTGHKNFREFPMV